MNESDIVACGTHSYATWCETNALLVHPLNCLFQIVDPQSNMIQGGNMYLVIEIVEDSECGTTINCPTTQKDQTNVRQEMLRLTGPVASSNSPWDLIRYQSVS
mmetsp:Transcript_7544/g.20913  ORF Transcript_7544/g.20913 Transcript_7544/m.20913 type:complete len:103 (+) Transcript_7544:1368-1676(+)